MFRLIRTIGVLGWLCASSTVFADDGAPPVQTIEVKGARTRLVAYKYPYYEFAKKVELAAHGRFVLAVQLIPSVPGARVDGVRMWLEGADQSIPVPVDEHGLFIVPVDDGMAAQDGQFSVNRKKGELMANAFLLPTVAKDAWTVGTVRAVMADARLAAKNLAPWYMKPFASLAARKQGISVCSKTPGAQVRIMQGESVIASLATSEPARDHAAQPVFCHKFTGEENYGEDARLALPGEAQVLFL